MQYINIPAGTTYPLILGDEVSAMNTAKIYLLCDTSSGVGVINILLPRITNGDNSLKNWWFEIFINDIGNNASVNNIKITPNPADKINGSGTQITLNANGVTGRIVVTSKTAWDFNIGSSSSDGFNTEFGTFVRLAGEPSGAQVVPTTNRAKVIFFTAQDNGSGDTGSDGKSNVSINTCINVGRAGANLSLVDETVCISVWKDDGSGGQDGTLTVININSFQLDWIKTGAGSINDITVKWIAITV